MSAAADGERALPLAWRVLDGTAGRMDGRAHAGVARWSGVAPGGDEGGGVAVVWWASDGTEHEAAHG